MSLPGLPGLKDFSKTHFGFPRTLVYSQGVPVPKEVFSSTTNRSLELLDAQNKVLDTEKAAELTYGPKRSPSRKIQLPRKLSMDKKVLRFSGYFQEEIFDWSRENYRIRTVNVLYYLQDDTMEVIEPKTPNSGLVQGTLLKRQAFPHPNGKGRNYLWKDLNLRTDIMVHGFNIRLTDCDQWTKEYLIDAGLELNEPEPIPQDPHEQQKLTMCPRNEMRIRNKEDEKLYRFLTNDRKVLRFYGIWQDILSEPPDMRRVVLKYYLADDKMEVIEDHAPNCGRIPFKVLVSRQKIPVDANELPDSFPKAYFEVKGDEMTWFKPQDLRTGKDIVILAKKIFLYDCDDFTRHYYKTHLGIEDMKSIAVVEKPKPAMTRILPPHNGIGTWEDSLQNCLSLIPKPPKKNLMKAQQFERVILRYKAELITPLKDDKMRQFVVTFYPCDDTVAINEESIPNSGYPGGAFLKKSKLPKPHTGLTVKPEFYTATDFYIGAEIRASGKLFSLIDADRFVLTFMEQHPEIYPKESIEIHRRIITDENLESDIELKERNNIMQMMRDDVIRNFGLSPYPLPSCLEPAFDSQYREKVDEELYCAKMPISSELLRKAVGICTDGKNRTDMNELRKLMLPALGHDINK